MNEFEILTARPPTCYLAAADQNLSFGTTFNDSKIWFNHIIRFEERETIHVGHLWKFVSCGAMVICPPNHYSIDIVVPVCFKAMCWDVKNTLAIIIQVKNDNYSCKKNSRNLFRRMGPFYAGLFDNKVANYAGYDIWYAGISPNTFACIGDDLPS
ncbi:hypothetical protein F5888DRAFT_1675341 [Russula emetica]|nr:hypothetical protein F5888DRAFT_1675341 [Russula emetica]